MNIETLNANLRAAGIPTDVYNTGGDVMVCRVITFEGEFLVSPSEVFEIEPDFMMGLYDADGEMIEWDDSISFPGVCNRIRQAL